MAKKSHKVTQVEAHCSSCLYTTKVDPSAIGRKHRKHNDPLGKKINNSKWISGKPPETNQPKVSERISEVYIGVQ